MGEYYGIAYLWADHCGGYYVKLDDAPAVHCSSLEEAQILIDIERGKQTDEKRP